MRETKEKDTNPVINCAHCTQVIVASTARRGLASSFFSFLGMRLRKKYGAIRGGFFVKREREVTDGRQKVGVRGTGVGKGGGKTRRSSKITL
jgi:hypothetical protein